MVSGFRHKGADKAKLDVFFVASLNKLLNK